MLQSKYKIHSIHTLCFCSKERPSSIKHTHIYSLLLLQRFEERLFVLPTVVSEPGWMGICTEVKVFYL